MKSEDEQSSFIGFFATWDELHITPSLIVREVRCKNPECQAIHGYQIILHWLFWAVMVNWRTA